MLTASKVNILISNLPFNLPSCRACMLAVRTQHRWHTLGVSSQVLQMVSCCCGAPRPLLTPVTSSCQVLPCWHSWCRTCNSRRCGTAGSRKHVQCDHNRGQSVTCQTCRSFFKPAGFLTPYSSGILNTASWAHNKQAEAMTQPSVICVMQEQSLLSVPSI